MKPETLWLPSTDTSKVKRPLLVHKQDFPIGLCLNSDELIVNTVNPYLQAIDSPYFKQYRFPREEDDFTLASIESQSTENLDGLIVYWTKPTFRWKGIDGEIGYGFFHQFHASINANIKVLDRIDLLPTFRASREGFDMEMNMKFNLWGGK
jgi:hypothetical protein